MAVVDFLGVVFVVFAVCVVQGSILLITYAIMCSIILFDGKAGR